MIDRLHVVRPELAPANNHDPFHWDLRVRITPSSLPAYLAWQAGSSMPPGTWIVAEHVGKEGGIAGPYYFANKTTAGWQFGSASPDGALLPPDPACSRCHAEAAADFVFGLMPRVTSRAQIDQRPDGG